jgi:hypothetical protein
MSALLPLGGAVGCGSVSIEPPPEEPPPPVIPAGELCFDPEPEQVRVRFEPRVVALGTGQRRSARLVVDPDFCVETALTFTSSAPEVAVAPAAASIAYARPTVDLEIVGGAHGEATITAVLPAGGGVDATATLAVEVLATDAPSCSDADATPAKLLEAGTTVAAAGTLAGASIALPKGADMPNGGSFLWSVTPFEVEIGCAGDIVPAGNVALGPAVKLGPEDERFARELPITLPINPARLPEEARWRHLRVAYAGPAASEPRTVAVTDPRVEKRDGRWVLSFKAPRLGRYQAVVREDAGTRRIQRRLTHRAVIGVSMGGAGAAQFGLRHHHLFDVVAALGGPVDWTWLVHHLEHNHLGGFRPIAPGTTLADIPLERTACKTSAECKSDEVCLGALPSASGKCALLPPADEPYEHASTFLDWWYEYPKTGHGGSFDRAEYVQIFRDLSLMFGNPNGYNPDALHLPAGVDPEHKAQTGDHANGACKIWVDPIATHPDVAKQEEIAKNCPAERCKYTQTLTGYYDDEYNPDGAFPVITFCDGSPQNEALTPYANTWTPRGNDVPMEVALAVDYNQNGKRDELEPVIRAGHESWDDWGEDGTPSTLEPGYGPDRLDPAGDDYDPQYNPSGTEGDHRWQKGEPWRDHGLDGVKGTVLSPFDHGENDGKLTVAPGLERLWDRDPHSIVRRTAKDMPYGELDDAALARIDFWTDGGTRDLFNFAVAARHLSGAFAARGRDVAYWSDFLAVPGLDPGAGLSPQQIVWDDLQGVAFQRYGKDEPTEADVESGSGQHVGTPGEITTRLQWAIYFIGSRWRDAPHAQHASSSEKLVDGACSDDTCVFDFTASDGRTGPVVVSLPPGYYHGDLQEVRYPVIYVLHGYGQTPEDLSAAIILIGNWMNSTTDSQYSRLAKAILVYVDGRCRVGKDEKAECIRGTFYLDSLRKDGPQMEKWFLELMDHVDRSYRTLGESVIEWTE